MSRRIVLTVLALATMACGGGGGKSPTAPGNPNFSASLQGVFLALGHAKTGDPLKSGATQALGPFEQVEVDVLITSSEQAKADLLPHPGTFVVEGSVPVAAGVQTPVKFFLTGKGQVQNFVVTVGNDPAKPDFTSDPIPFSLVVI